MEKQTTKNAIKKSNDGLMALLIIISGLFFGIFAFFLATFAYEQSHLDRVFERVYVSGLNLGGLTRSEAEEKLRAGLKYPFESAFAFSYGGNTWHAIPEELGMQIQFAATMNKVWAVGRNGNWADNLGSQLMALTFSVRIEPVMLFDERVGFNFISNLASYIDKPMEQPSITLQGNQVIITPGQTGLAVDRQMTMTLLQIYGRNLQTGAIDIPVAVLEPSASNLEEQQRILQSLLNQDFSLFIQEESGVKVVDTISSDTLAGLIQFNPEVVDNKVNILMVPKREPFYNRIVAIGSAINQEPKNARFVFNDNTHEIEPIAEAIIGKKADIEASLQNIAQAFKEGRNQAEIAFEIIQPVVNSSAKGSDLGITQLAQSQYTYFFGSDAARVQNIKTGAAVFHGLLVAPGEVFSMVENLGAIDTDSGYAEAAVISGDRTVQGVGGGICQVSTTLFRAAFNYGLPIIERHAHAYRVFYYERIANGTIDPRLSGLDASIYAPILDLKFKNDTPYWILMETYVYPESSTFQWKFYSTDVDRYVEWDTSGLTNVEEPDEPVYKENAELAPGVIEQVDYAVKGADVTITRTVYEKGAVHLQDRFLSHYKVWTDIFEYGPGTPGMPPETKEKRAP